MKSSSPPKPLASCVWSLEKLPGMSRKHYDQLYQLDIKTTADILQKMGSSTQRIEYAKKLRLPIKVLNKWIALSDLARVKSIGCEYNGLLLHAGVASVIQLSQMSANHIHHQVLKLQVSLMQRRDLCPSVDRVSQWIYDARKLL